MPDNKPYTFDRVFRIGLTVGSVVAVIWLLNYLSEALIPFAIAFLLAYLINPIVCWVQKKVRHRMAAVLLTLTGLTALMCLSAYLVFQPVKKEFNNLKDLLAKTQEDSRVKDRVNKLRETIKAKSGIDVLNEDDLKKIVDNVDEGKAATALQEGAQKLFPVAKGVMTGVKNVVLWLLGLTVILLYLVFILGDYQSVRKDWKHLMPPKWKEYIAEFVEEFDVIMNQHFRAQAVVAFICGILFAVGFSVIGLPMAILMGLFVGALNMIPYVQVVGLIPAGILSVMMAVNQDISVMSALLQTGAVFVVVQVIQDAILVPRIMGQVTGMKPAMILLSISIWGKLLGFLGLLIALPATCLVLAYYHRFILKRPIKSRSKS